MLLMKNFTKRLLTAALAIVFTGQFAAYADVTEYPYEPTTYNDGLWEGYRSNQYNATWDLDYGSSVKSAYLEIKTYQSNRVRLFSPALVMKSGFRYTVAFTVQGITNGNGYDVTPYITSEKIKSVLTADGVPEKILYTGQNAQATNTRANNISFDFDCQTDGSYYFMLDAIPSTDKIRKFTFKNFKVTAVELVKKPLPVTDLSIEVLDKNNRQVKLSWTNPTKYLTGEDFTPASVKILRNDVAVATLTDAQYLGATATWTDQPAESGTYTYTVSVLDSNGKESDPETVMSPFIGKPAPLTVPHEFDFSDATANSFWNIVTADGANGWDFYNYYSSNYLRCQLDGYKPTDSSVTSPEITLDNTKAYRLTYKAQCTAASNVFGYSLALNADGASEPVTLLTTDNFSPAANNKDEEISLSFSPATSGAATLTWNAKLAQLSSQYYKNEFKISALKIEEIPVVPLCATELSATEAEDGAKTVHLTWKNPEHSETGLALTGLTATVYRDRIAIGSPISVEPGATSTFDDTESLGLTDGYHTYQVVISNAAGYSATEPMATRTGYVGKTRAIPYAADFTEPAVFKCTEYGEKANGTVFTVDVANGAELNDKPAEFADALMTPPMNLKKGHVYNASVALKNEGYSSYKFDLVAVPKSNPEDLSLILNKDGNFETSNKVSTSEVKFAVCEAGEYMLALVMRPATYGSTAYKITVSGMSVTEASVIPEVPKEIKAIYDESRNVVKLSWTMPTASPEGAPLTGNVIAEIYRGATAPSTAPETASLRADTSGETDMDPEPEQPVATLEKAPGEECFWLDEAPVEGEKAYRVVFTHKGTDEVLGGSSVAAVVQSEIGTVGVGSIFADAIGVTIRENLISAPEGVVIELYTLAGELVKASAEGSMDVTTLPAGVYILRAYASDAVQSVKFIKH